MKWKITALAALLALSILLTGCARTDAPSAATTEPAPTEAATAQTIDAATAYERMNASDGYILLDVRTPDEYAEAHIEGAVLLPDYDIEARAAEVLPDKDQVIYLYCRSGRRSANSATLLTDMGYTNIYDFGGIIDWPYAIVSGDN